MGTIISNMFWGSCNPPTPAIVLVRSAIFPHFYFIYLFYIFCFILSFWLLSSHHTWVSCWFGSITGRSVGTPPRYMQFYEFGISVFLYFGLFSLEFEVTISDYLVFSLSMWATNFLYNWKPWMFSEDYRRGVCLDDLDNGIEMKAIINE